MRPSTLSRITARSRTTCLTRRHGSIRACSWAKGTGLRPVPPLDAAKAGSQWFWHDVHARVLGPAAYSLADNFLNRYLNAQSRTNPNDLPKHDDDVKAEVQLYRDSDGALKVRGDGTVPPP